jgi:type II secretory pathway pseudopilin PulG
MQLKRTAKRKVDGRAESGFTIVELLIAAVIMIIATFAVIVVIRQSTAMEVEDHHAKQARMIIMGLFEEVFDVRGYPKGYGAFAIDSGKTSFDTAYDVIVDKRSYRSEPLTGGLFVSVVHDTVEVNSARVGVDRVSARVTWTESDGTRDTVALSKVLAGVE